MKKITKTRKVCVSELLGDCQAFAERGDRNGWGGGDFSPFTRPTQSPRIPQILPSERYLLFRV